MRRRGFTLVEVMISLAVLMLVMSAVSTFFLGTLQTYKQQSRVVQSGMDSIIGLEMLRRDIERAGYGLPWNNLPAYNEAGSGILNDSPTNAPPRGIVSVNGGGLNSSDYLVIKASTVTTSDAGRKWTTLQVGDVKRSWTTVPANAENLNGTDLVIVMSPGNTGTNWRSLVVDGVGNWFTTFNNTSGFQPATAADTRVIYGIDGAGGNLWMPFNRADYTVSTANVPERCAPNTGVLVKRVVLQTNGNLDTALPLLDCVASMQVQYDLDTNGDGVVESPPANDISGLTAAQIRDQVRQVRVSLLAHEGQRDPGYTHSPTTISVAGNAVDISANANYRWKVYTLMVTPDNLR